MDIAKSSPVLSCPRHLFLISLDWTRAKDPRVPLGHASLMAAVRSAGRVRVTGCSIAINDPSFDPEQVVQQALEQVSAAAPGPCDIGLGVYVWNDAHVRFILTRLRACGFTGRIVLGGPQISYAGPGLEALYPEADVFVRGYGEEALTALAGSEERVRLEGVHWAGEEDRCGQAKVDLTRLASPFLTGELELKPGQRFIRWETQRGCPYRCSFCQHREAGARLTHRTLDSARLRQEIAHFVASSIDDIAVLDPIFNLGPNSLDILHAFREQGYRGRLSLQCRFESLDEAFLEACEGLDVRLEFGLQTIHEREGRAIQRYNKLERVEHAITALQARAIPFEVSLIFGLPEQTLASFRETVDFCLRRRVPVIKAFPLMLLRGTPLERERARWSLQEDGETIPAVISSNTFDRRDWRQMARIAEALVRTEGRHPQSVALLEGGTRQRLEVKGRWSPLWRPRLPAWRRLPGNSGKEAPLLLSLTGGLERAACRQSPLRHSTRRKGGRGSSDLSLCGEGLVHRAAHERSIP